MFAPKNILVPTDFSAYSDAALRDAIALAKKFDSRIYLLHVIDEGIQQCVELYCLSQETINAIDLEGKKTSRAKLEEEVKTLSESEKADIQFDIRKGVPYEEILKDAKEKAVDLIVIASHGRTGILRNLMGGVAEKVVKSADCPVLVIKSRGK